MEGQQGLERRARSRNWRKTERKKEGTSRKLPRSLAVGIGPSDGNNRGEALDATLILSGKLEARHHKDT